jgi:hypothetical protein
MTSALSCSRKSFDAKKHRLSKWHHIVRVRLKKRLNLRNFLRRFYEPLATVKGLARYWREIRNLKVSAHSLGDLHLDCSGAFVPAIASLKRGKEGKGCNEGKEEGGGGGGHTAALCSAPDHELCQC